MDILKQLPDKSIDLVLTDPPYNISQKNFCIDRSRAKSAIMGRSKPLNYDFGDWDNMDRKEFLDFTKGWLLECIRVLRDGGTLISFFNKEDISYLGWIAQEYGIRTKTIFTWHKTNPVPSFRKVNYLSACEFAWIGSKGEKKWTFNFKTQKEMHNFFETPNASCYKETKHPTEKPKVLFEHLLNIHSNKNDLVLDCFSGGGTTAVACIETGRNFICIEKDKDYYYASCERLQNCLNGQFNSLIGG
jgi:site-specific DNA-methyltransferase (adenine-specific)/modification methylase